VRLCWWFVPAREVPRDPDGQEDWLYGHWAQLDSWVAARTRPD
jgi:hypothetical protein